jgi:hypothetical protein
VFGIQEKSVNINGDLHEAKLMEWINTVLIIITACLMVCILFMLVKMDKANSRKEIKPVWIPGGEAAAENIEKTEVLSQRVAKAETNPAISEEELLVVISAAVAAMGIHGRVTGVRPVPLTHWKMAGRMAALHM